MNQAINTCITGLNNLGQGFWNYAAGIFIQASVLILLLLIIDFLLRKRIRAVFRYCLWMLVFIKLVLPASFTLPTGIGYWLGDYFPSEVSVAKFVPQTEEAVPIAIDIPQGYIPFEMPIMNETAATGIELEPIYWQGLLFFGWLVGMLVLLVLLVKRVCFVRELIAQSKPANERLLDMLNEGRSQIGIRQNIELRLSGNTLSPAVCGLFKPIILIPATLLKKLSPEKLKAVLIHELAHIKRGDAWVNLLQTILQIVYFYNPFVWIANAMVRSVREQAVDEMVLVTLKPETNSYSNMLIDIAEMAFWRPKFSLRLISVIESKKALERRINHMLNRPVPKSSKLGYLGLVAIVVIGSIILPMGHNPAEQTALAASVNDERIEDNKIVPGIRVGEYTLGISKDDVVKELGEPEAIQLVEKEEVVHHRGEEKYNLNDLPKEYLMVFGDVSFGIEDDSVGMIFVRSRLYKLSNGLRVGNSEQRIKQVFGDEFQTEEALGKDYLCYHVRGLAFEIDKKNQTIAEIVVYHPEGDRDAADRQKHSKHTIVPGLRVGEYTFGMSKDDVLESLGKPKAIFYGSEKYTLDNLPRHYYMSFGDVSFRILDDSVKEITVLSPSYKFANGLGVGDSEQKIKELFGNDFHIREFERKDFLSYEDKGLMFEINKQDRTVMEINVSPIERSKSYQKADIVTNIIVPGFRVGNYTFDMSKDDVLEALGKPGGIFYGDEKYTLGNLPEKYYMPYEDISFLIVNDSVKGITALSPSFKLPNGLGVGDSEQKIKKAFGKDFRIEKGRGKDFLSYKDEGLVFEIHKQDRTVMEINVSPIPGSESYKKANIPPTSYINEKGRIVDKVDYPFVNDPKVVGGWKSVDFVREIYQFNPNKKNWKGALHLNHLIFEEGGTMPRSGQWTKGLVLDDDTASKYIIKEIDGSAYMFYEWKSGDYTIRYMKPFYYVLKKVLSESLKYEPKYGKKANIPPTSTINEQGHIVDKIDYPFVNDSQVLGTWKSVDFVGEMEQFKLGEQQWKGRGGELFLNDMIFENNGRLTCTNDKVPSGYSRTWTKGLVISDNDTKTASKYTIKEIDGSAYMFYEWKSGDYTFRHRKPSYYVLKKVSSEAVREPMVGEKTHIPPTSTINEDGRIVDKIDYPFINDSQLIGTWKSVDFVGEMKQFRAGQRRWGGDLYLKGLIFRPDGKTFKPWWTWTKGLVFHSGDKTASKYTLKDIEGSTYMFYEWKSGDYTIRHRKPAYYVLKKVSSKTSGPLDKVWISKQEDEEDEEDEEFTRRLPSKIRQLDIDTADLERVIEIFGKPIKYVWGKNTFAEDNLPKRYILVYPNRFHIYMRENQIVELRHELDFSYVFRGKIRSGSTLDEVFEVIGHPEKIVRGEENSFKDGVLYKDIDGRKGHCYYARSDQDVRLWFKDYKIGAIYMTRSDYGE